MKKIAIIISAFLLAALLVPGLLFYFGYVWFIDPSVEEYPLRGIDVSEHQGDINWEEVGEAGKGFTFIKATEGMDHKDAYFERNWTESRDAGLVRGAYHFFTFRSPGLEQAKNFIETVPVDETSLPPTIDIEFGGNSREMPTRGAFDDELRDFIGEIESHYYRKPILYVTYESYEAFIEGDFEDCSIWIRDLFKEPRLSDGRHWSFWQYSPRGRVSGISGYVDLNVFNGDREEFDEMIWQPAIEEQLILKDFYRMPGSGCRPSILLGSFVPGWDIDSIPYHQASGWTSSRSCPPIV